MEEDWYSADNVYTEINYGAKRCQPDDFGKDNQSHAFWHTWVTDDYAFDLFCPDYDLGNMTIYNQKGAMQSKSILFKIKYCQNDTKKDGEMCKSREDIDAFINEMTVQLWVIESSIDMRFKHGESFARN